MKNKIIFRGNEVEITHNGGKVTNYKGDNTLITILKKEFEKPLTTMVGETDEIEGIEEDIDYSQTLNPGDAGYISAIMYDRLQSEIGMEIE